MGEKVLENKLHPLSDLLDGLVDCDKPDYLRRDSHHCGVPYGIGLDVQGVLRSFRCSDNGDQLLIDIDGIHAVEGFMIAQDQMLGAVYWHETIRAVFAMFHAILAGTVGLNSQLLINLVEKLKTCTSDYDAIHNVLLPLIKDTPPKNGKSFADELMLLLNLHFRPSFNEIYRRIAKYSSLDSVRPKSRSGDTIFTSIVLPVDSAATSMPINWDRAKRLRNCTRWAFKEKNYILGSFDVLVDIPWGKASNRVVRVLDKEGGTPRPITDFSHLAPTIFENPTAYSAPIRVYVLPTLFEVSDWQMESIRTSAEEKYFSSEEMLDEIGFD